ncbi:MAG TPA: NfeD family protein [Spirochaetota bacterium]|nr:NfeD family protein [Spirochaetota bacterium]HNT10972.1 NfeD family protein [Spirochaetota bacterium]HNV46798.1 NfeD family protein [Spirochaetota bacterium]HOS38372.1 NfeD family protein [Spirochaetota bacterium]HPU90087.1 NfeD family protein [Spirochaetota bacterium]
MALSPLVWLAAGIVIMALEIIMPGFIIFWFGAGAVLTALFVFIGIIPGDAAEIQWIFFFLSSLAMLGAWQFFFKKRFKGETADLSRDATLANLRGRVTSRITPGVPGEVELYNPYHGIKKWHAESADTIEVGEEILVQDASGIRLIVTRAG